MNEKRIESGLVRMVKAAGGMALKLVSPGMAGVPDRLVLLPGGHVLFVEVKAPGRKLRALQQKRAAQLEALGFRVFTVDATEAAAKVIQEALDR